MGEFSGIEAGNIGGESGFWIRNASAECFVTAEKRIRILHFAKTGRPNLFLRSGSLADGLRCWIMSPHDDEDERDDLASEVGAMEEEETFQLRVRTSAPSKLGFLLDWRISLDPEQPVLTVEHVLEYHGNANREIAIWPVIGISSGSRIILPLKQIGERTKDTRALYHFPWSNLQDPRIATGMDHIQLDIRPGTEEDHIKFGVHQASGSGAALIGESVLVSYTPLDPTGSYPEGGPNLTGYGAPANGNQPYGELENVGTLHIVRPGHSISLKQQLTIEDAADSPFLQSIGYTGTR